MTFMFHVFNKVDHYYHQTFLCLRMKPLISIELFIYAILLFALGNYVQGKARIIQAPLSPFYVVSGGTARFVWDYTVDNRTEEFQVSSPGWKYQYANGTMVDIGYEHFLQNWKWIINSAECPSRLLKPTVRVNKEATATLVISNVTTADSGIYEMVLFLTAAQSIISKVQLIINTWPKITGQFQAHQSIPEGKDLRINCTAVGNPTPNITWLLLKDRQIEAKSQGVGYAELLLQNITRHQSGTYRCQATNNPTENPVERETEVTVWYKPYVTVLNWTSVEEKIILLCLASGIPRPLITWYYPNHTKVESGVTEITDGSRMVLELPDSNGDLYGIYKCNATNEEGWQVGNINLSQIHFPTTWAGRDKKIKASDLPTTRAVTEYVTLTSVRDKKTKATTGRRSFEKTKHKLNIVLVCVFGVAIPLAITVSLIIVFRKRCKPRSIQENKTDDDRDIPLNDVLPGQSNIITCEEVKTMPVYAQIDKAKKDIKKRDENMPIYAQIDKRKKKRPGQIIYAELEDIKSSAETKLVTLPPPCKATEYADIKDLQKPVFSSAPEPIYETLPDN